MKIDVKSKTKPRVVVINLFL